jgi:hypothetical protein
MHVEALAIDLAGKYNGESIHYSIQQAGIKFRGATGNKTFTSWGGDSAENRFDFLDFKKITMNCGSWEICLLG